MKGFCDRLVSDMFFTSAVTRCLDECKKQTKTYKIHIKPTTTKNKTLKQQLKTHRKMIKQKQQQDHEQPIKTNLKRTNKQIIKNK